MKRNIHEWFRKIQILLAVAMAIYPLHWLSTAWLGALYIGVVWLYPVGAVLVGVLALKIPGKFRPLFGGSVCLALLAGTVFLAPPEERLLWFIQSLLACAQVFGGLPVASKDSRSELSGYWISLGIAMQVAGQIALLTDWAAGFPGWMLQIGRGVV